MHNTADVIAQVLFISRLLHVLGRAVALVKCLCPIERLGKPADLARWCTEAGFTSAPLVITDIQLREALELREGIVRAAHAVRQGRSVEFKDRTLINHWAAKPALAPQLANDRGDTLSWVCEGARIGAVLALIARDFVDLLVSDLAAKIKACADPHCNGLYVDISRPGNRRWCSMGTCGNRAKKASLASKRAPVMRNG